MRANYKMQRLFLGEDLAAGVAVTVDRGQSNYLLNVLRLRDGDTILAFNGRDGEWEMRLQTTGRKAASLVALQQVRPQSPAPTLIYCFAPLKVGRLDYMVQKAVEMGAGVLRPVITQHTQNHRLNTDKMRTNATEAAEQCGILTIPDCHAPVKLNELLAQWDETQPLIFCDEAHGEQNPIALLEPLYGKLPGVLIGPEGGFSDEEREQLRAQPFVTSVPLGPRILRADTAAVAALTLIQAVAGDWR